MKVAVLGCTGMLGWQVLDQLKKIEGLEIIATCRDFLDVESSDQVTYKKLDAQEASSSDLEELLLGCDWAVNCIGIIKPYIHDDNPDEVSRAILVNSNFPHILSKAAESTQTKVIQIAMDCVWDGLKGAYVETDHHNAIDVYGKSKSLGEAESKWVYNIRCSIIGREKKGFLSLLDWFLNQPKGAQIRGFTNHKWNGVTTLSFAKLCAGIIINNIPLKPMQHWVPANKLTKFDMLHSFVNSFNRSDIKISDFETETPVYCDIDTLDQEHNRALWKVAGYGKIPTVEQIIEELATYSNK